MAKKTLEKVPKIKTVAVGDYAVGKTCLFIRFVTQKYPQDYVPTIFDNYLEKVTVGEQEVNFDLFDTAGGEDYPRLRPLSYPGTNVFLLCFSPELRITFTNLKTDWIPELKKHCPDVPIILVGNKSDLRFDAKCMNNQQGDQLFVTSEEATVASEEIGAVKYMECSALTGKGVSEVFQEAARVALEHKLAQHDKKTSCCQII